MGFNTTVLILNDALREIEEDPNFSKNLVAAIQEASSGEQICVSAHTKHSVHCNAATVIESHHADYDILIKVGHNRAEVQK